MHLIISSSNTLQIHDVYYLHYCELGLELKTFTGEKQRKRSFHFFRTLPLTFVLATIIKNPNVHKSSDVYVVERQCKTCLACGCELLS